MNTRREQRMLIADGHGLLALGHSVGKFLGIPKPLIECQNAHSTS